MSKHARHRGTPRKRYPLPVLIYAAKNKWHYFTKPKLKLASLRLANQALDLTVQLLTKLGNLTKRRTK